MIRAGGMKMLMVVISKMNGCKKMVFGITLIKMAIWLLVLRQLMERIIHLMVLED